MVFGGKVDLFDFVLYLIEHLPLMVTLNIGLLMVVKKKMRCCTFFLLPMITVGLILIVVLGSYTSAIEKGYDMSKPSLRDALEAYVETGVGVPEDIFVAGHPPTMGKMEIRYMLKDLLRHTIFHKSGDDSAVNLPEAYDKGNDWFRATLGEAMVYTSGVYLNGDESLVDAQERKLDYVANALDLQTGDTLLDIGCGWGRLAKHMTERYGAQVTGVTLSKEQLAYGQELNAGNGANLLLQDATKIASDNPALVPAGGWDKITALEMAEHVGIRRYTDFVSSVRGLLADDGTLYWQVAGLRRRWQFQDLVWGLFMGEHVFPGADASCPLGWVTTHLERGGFEVQRVHNLGAHYSKTLGQWKDEWRAAKGGMMAKYGEVSWRRWEVFLSWSEFIALEGQSTVFMITATKSGVDKQVRADKQHHLTPRW